MMMGAMNVHEPPSLATRSAMRSEQLAALLLKQQEQIDMLTRLLARADRAGPCGPVV